MQALMYMDCVLMGEDFPDIDKSDEDSYKHNAFVCDFSKQDMRLLRELFYKLKKMKKDDSEQTDSNHTSSLTSQDNE
jgi:hypothetical protein